MRATIVTRRALLVAFAAAIAICLPGHAGAQSSGGHSSGARTPGARVTAQCSVSERSVSQVLALREHMVMLAVKCGRTEDYETKFSQRFPKALQANETAVTAWFARKYGSAGTAQKDRYTSELVDIASRDALGQDQEYCSAAADRLIDGLDALKSGDELARFAAVTNPAAATMSLCDWAARNP
jgi:hypothetical protein